MYKTWQLRGIAHPLSLKVGNLEHWKLRREVISSGILLFGKYQQLPEKIDYYLLIIIDKIHKKSIAQQIKIWRALYGYKQKVGKKTYEKKGYVESLNGKKLGKAVFLIPMEQRKTILLFLNEHNVDYRMHEVWSDAL